jgi:LysM repeat protein
MFSLALYSLAQSTNVRRIALLLVVCIALTAVVVPTVAFAAPQSAPAASGNYHVVKAGETLSHIARYYGVTINALKHANGLDNANYVYVGQHLHIPYGSSGGGGHHAGCTSYYYVKHGDKLSKIAAWYGMNTHALANANGIGDANYIYVGQKLCIPNIYGGGYGHKPGGDGHKPGGHGYGHYKVKAGDTLSEIAKWNGTTVRHLMHLNGLGNANYIYVGQWLRLS